MFADYPTKELAVSTAERLLSSDTPPHITCQVWLRRQTLGQLYGHRLSLPDDLPPPRNSWLNAQHAQFLILTAQQDIEDGAFANIWTYLHWKPLNAAQPSKIEEIVASSLTCLEGKLHRFQGQFVAAQNRLELLNGQLPPPSCEFLVKLHLAAVYSELGLWEGAEKVLKSIRDATGSRSRLAELSRAEVELSKCLARYDPKRWDGCATSFRNLSQSYMREDLKQKSKTMRRNLLRACIGLAIISHLQTGRSDNIISLVDTLGQWQTAIAACRECLISDEGFIDLICYLGSAEVRLRMSDPMADTDLAKAVDIRDRLGGRSMLHRFIFASLGTRWSDMLDDWIEGHGRDRVLSRWGGPRPDNDTFSEKAGGHQYSQNSFLPEER